MRRSDPPLPHVDSLLQCAPSNHALLVEISRHPDLETSTLAKLLQIVARERLLSPAEQATLGELIETVETLALADAAREAPPHPHEGVGADAAAGGARGGAAIWEALSRELDAPEGGGGEGGGGGGEDGGGGEGSGSENTAPAASDQPASTTGGGGALTESLVTAYTEALEEQVFDASDLVGDGASQTHHYAEQAASAESGGSTLPALRKKLMREVRDLQGGVLPLHPNAAIFVRQDESRMNVWRALISGPVDTPYAYGLFTFDIFCPPGARRRLCQG